MYLFLIMDLTLLHRELKFSTARSSGSGGQHVNKVETKVILYFSIEESKVLNDEQKSMLLNRLSSYISKDDVLILSHGRKRSQLANKREVVKKFNALVTRALTKRKKRIQTRPTLNSIAVRRKAKSKRAEIKSLRKRPSIFD